MKGRTVFLSCVLALATGLAQAQAHSPAVSKSEQLRDAMRTLWDDHVVWTRLFIVSTLADLPDAPATTERLLQNQTDIGNAVKPFYGEAAGTKLTGLLREHILIAAEIVKGAKAGETAKVDAAKTKWNTNADEIAVFLSGANPKNWPAAEMKTMMRRPPRPDGHRARDAPEEGLEGRRRELRPCRGTDHEDGRHAE
jgi:hypothetical protein